MKTVSIIAIDRAEAEVGRAAKKFARTHKVTVKAYLLVNEGFKASPAYRGDENNGYFKEIVCDFDDTKTLQKILHDICGDNPIFHCRMEEAIKDFAKVVPLVRGAYVPTREALLNSTMKHEMRIQISKKYPAICPLFVELKSAQEFKPEIIKGFTFPVIVKPNGLHSSFFVTKCLTVSELETCIKDTFKGIEAVYQREYGTGKPSILIEEFIEGEMYSIDAYSDANGNVTCLPLVRVVTAAELGLDGYYSYRHIIPVGLSEADIAGAKRCTEQAITSLELTSSSAHVELYKTKNGWKIIEVGPRIGGYRQELYLHAYGIDHYYNDLLIHYGEQPDVEIKWRKHAAGLNIYADSEGKITSIEGHEAARGLSSVVFLNVNIPAGGEAKFASRGGQFVIDGILAHEDKNTLEQHVATVRELIDIIVE